MRLLVADDHGLFREGLVLWLSRLSDGVEVITAGDLDGTLAALAVDGPFSLVVSDLVMPGMNGVAGMERLCQASGYQPVLVLSARRHPLTISACLQAGARGYLAKDSDGETVLAAVRRLLAGEMVLPPGFHAPDHRLRPRQLALLHCLAEGLSNKAIATALNLSEGTVKQYLNGLYLDLGVQNRSQAAVEAREILALPDY